MPKLIFIHLPKTGGTTLRRILAQQYGAGAIFLVDGYDIQGSIEKYRALSEPQAREIQVFVGHMPFGWHELLDEPAVYMTMVRHPLTRIVSHYRYVLRTPEAAFHEHTAASNPTLSSYVSASSGAGFFNNGQTRLLAGPLLQEGYAPDARALDRAKENLTQHFVVAGTTERFDRSLFLLKNELGWDPPYYERLNIAPADEGSSSPEDVREVLAHNGLDIDLYRFVSDRLDETWRDVAWRKKVSAFAFTTHNHLREVKNKELARSQVQVKRIKRSLRRIVRRTRMRRASG